MTDQVYFLGYRAEHFTGWDGSGSPSYTSITSTDANEPNSLGYINLSTSGNVIWKDLDITDTSSPIYMMVELNCSSINDYIYGNFSITDGQKTISIVNFANGNNYVTILPGTYSSSGNLSFSTTLSEINVTSSNILTSKFYIKLYSTTSGFDTIDIVEILYGSSTEYKIYSGSIPSLSEVKAVFSSKVDYGPFHNRNCSFYYCVVANFDMTGGYLDYTKVSSSGYYDDWSGTVSTLNTYPMVPGTTSNGLYSYNIGDKATFTSSKQLNTNSTMEPKFIFVESSLSSTIDNSKAQGIISNSGTNLVYSLGSADALTTTNTSYQWFSNQNPATLSSWTVDTINSYNFGIQRTA